MKIALYGYGRMGKAIEQAALARGHQVVLHVDQHNAGTPPTGAEVAIEFSRPEQAIANMRLCVGNKVPVVVGTTGWYEHLDEVKAFVEQQHGSVLWASNFSIGVNLFFELNRQLASLMDRHPEYQASMEEVHHVHKLDAPSGTAITLACGVGDVHTRYQGWVLAEGNASGPGPATPGGKRPLPIASIRKDEVPGTHTVAWTSPDDRISVTHEAFGRHGFATGAVVAAEWLRGRAGLFTMQDVLRDAQ